MDTIKLKFVGLSSMLLHSDRGANPLATDTAAHKTLTDKQKKTDADHKDIAKSEFMLGFYSNEEISIPSQNIKSALVGGAKFNKLGAAFKRCVMILDEWTPISHSGPSTRELMWKSPACVDCRSVKINTSRLMRDRLRLSDWSLEVVVHYDESLIEKRQVLAAANNVGTYIGLGDYRPENGGMFGRFKVEEVK